MEGKSDSSWVFSFLLRLGPRVIYLWPEVVLYFFQHVNSSEIANQGKTLIKNICISHWKWWSNIHGLSKKSSWIFLCKLLWSVVHVDTFKKCTVTVLWQGKCILLLWRSSKFLLAKLIFFAVLLSLDVMGVAVRSMCCVGRVCLFVLNRVSGVAGLE